MTQVRYRASLDFLTIDITGPSVVIVEADAFQICFSRSLSLPLVPVWYAATNNHDGTITLLAGPNSPALVTTLTAGCWFMMVQVTDSPSIPIFYGGDICIQD